jgi:hypothetical protein
MKKFLILTLFVILALALGSFAQTAPPTHTFTLALSPISLPGNHQTVAGTEAGTMFNVTPNNNFGMVTVQAPAQAFQYYAGRYERSLPFLANALNNASPNLNFLKFQFGVIATVGVTRITSVDRQHFGYTGGGYVNYSIDQGGHYSLGAEIQYARFPGLANNTWTVSLDPAVHF